MRISMAHFLINDSRWILVKPIRGQLDIRDVPWIDFEFFPSVKPYQSHFL